MWHNFDQLLIVLTATCTSPRWKHAEPIELSRGQLKPSRTQFSPTVCPPHNLFVVFARVAPSFLAILAVPSRSAPCKVTSGHLSLPRIQAEPLCLLPSGVWKSRSCQCLTSAAIRRSLHISRTQSREATPAQGPILNSTSKKTNFE